MLNVGGAEFLVIMLVALIVLGPAKLPEVARQVGAMARELRRISSSFQAELKSALDDPVEEAARERGHKVVSSEETPKPEPDKSDEPVSTEETASEESEPDEPDPEISTAEAAGMYDITKPDPDQEVSDTADESDDESGDGPEPA